MVDMMREEIFFGDNRMMKIIDVKKNEGHVLSPVRLTV